MFSDKEIPPTLEIGLNKQNFFKLYKYFTKQFFRPTHDKQISSKMQTFVLFCSTYEKGVEGHAEAGNCHVGTQPLSDPGTLPERSQNSSFVSIHE